jgi:predicted transposase YbfD/YdcC
MKTIKKFSKLVNSKKVKEEKINFKKKSVIKTITKITQSQIKDPRRTGRVEYKLENIIIMALIGTMAGAQNWVAIADYCEDTLAWFRKVLKDKKLKCPAHDTFRRVFMLLKPKELGKLFQYWIEGITNKRRHISVDGKTANSSLRPRIDGDDSILHMINIVENDSKICFASERSDGKRNENVTTEQMLDAVSVENAVVTVDAMNTQVKIADVIIEGGGSYILRVKGNQGNLHKAVKKVVKTEYSTTRSTNVREDDGHGRIEERKCTVVAVNLNSSFAKKFRPIWKNLETIIMVRSKSINKKTGKVQREERYYISDIKGRSAKYFNEIIRGHWGVEVLHNFLDKDFDEDNRMLKTGNGLENVTLLNKYAYNLLKEETSMFPKGASMQRKIKKFSRNEEFRNEVLGVI